MKKIFWLWCVLFFFLSTSCSRSSYEEPARSPPPKKVQVSKKEATILQKVKPKPITPKEVCIVIDGGHGGGDTGTKSLLAPNTKEKVLTLKTAIGVKEFLQKMGYTVYLTRKRDVFIPLPNRVKCAEQCNADLFISIHFNHAPNPQAHGIEIYYFKDSKDLIRTKRSKELATLLLQRMCASTKAHSRGVMAGDFHVIRETKMPAVLIEGGFLSNSQEAKKLRTNCYIRLLSLSIAKGVDDYIKKTIVFPSHPPS